MTSNNHEIRFRCNQEESNKAEGLSKKFFKIKKREFYKSLFFWALNLFEENLIKGQSPIFTEENLSFERRKHK